MSEFSSEENTTTDSGYRLPTQTTLYHAAKIGVVEDKPIMMDYWTHSIDKTVAIGVKDNNEKLLVKSDEEYTSPISKIFKIGQEYIIQTENSIYLVDLKIPTKRITTA
jgi:sporulation protein YlmC with PRC-barrel domain|tara:strand:- start:542 stop:865 length:324 start_codon:yes stop_codon:yes gene_type:complete